MRRGIDERAGLWAVLLPAAAPRRAVLLDVPAAVREVLLRRYPDAVVDGDLDGADLVVCSAAARPAAPPPGAALAVLGGPRTPASALILGPLEEPTGVLLPGRRAPLLRRHRGTPVTVTTTLPSLADSVLAAYAPGSRLVEVLGGSSVVLHATSPRGEAAIRFGLTPLAERGGAENLRAVAALTKAAWLPREVATGQTGGVTWTAYAWAGTPRTDRTWSPDGPGWTFCRAVADTLGTFRTGAIGPGWAEAWLAAADPFDPEARAAFADRLAALPDGVPTAWCHGDLWPRNVVFAGDGAPTVVDWDNARPDAPAGVDAILVEAFRLAARGRRTFGEACRDLCAGGDAERTGLVSAAFLLHTIQRDVTDLDDAWRAANLVPFLRA